MSNLICWNQIATLSFLKLTMTSSQESMTKPDCRQAGNLANYNMIDRTLVLASNYQNPIFVMPGIT